MSSLSRILRWVAIGAALFIVVMTIQSRRPDAGRNEYTIIIDRPPSEVFPWITEAYRLTRWMNGLESSVQVSGDSAARGSKSRETILVNRKRYTFLSEIIDLKRDTLLVVHIVSDPPGFTINSVYELSPAGAGTRLHYIGRADYVSLFARVMEPIITPQSQRKVESDLKRLKNLVEAQPGSRGI